MRIISQNGDFDIEYKNCYLIVNRKCFEIEAETNNPNFTPVMASYSSIEKCRKAMEMLREAYCGVPNLKNENYELGEFDLKRIEKEMKKPHFLEVRPNNSVAECRVFLFPANDEVEV